MDMATIKGLPVNEQTVREMFEEICKIELEDDVTFSFRSIGEIREGDVYTGYRVSCPHQSFGAEYKIVTLPTYKEIEKGMSDVKAGRVYSADAIEAEMKRDFGI